MRMKDVITNQQLTIENHEQKLRAKNLIVHNIPEDEVSFGSETLKNDRDKIIVLARTNNVDAKPEDIVTVRRLGNKRADRFRPLKVTLSDSDKKFKFLNKRKFIAANDEMKNIFHNRIFVNTDSSFLVQKEESRLRERLKELKREDPNTPIYIRSGALYYDGGIIDKVDVTNQLF